MAQDCIINSGFRMSVREEIIQVLDRHDIKLKASAVGIEPSPFVKSQRLITLIVTRFYTFVSDEIAALDVFKRLGWKFVSQNTFSASKIFHKVVLTFDGK